MRLIIALVLTFAIAALVSGAPTEPLKPGKRYDLVLAGDGVLQDVEILKVEGGAAVIMSGKTLRSIRLIDIRASRLVAPKDEPAQTDTESQTDSPQTVPAEPKSSLVEAARVKEPSPAPLNLSTSVQPRPASIGGYVIGIALLIALTLSLGVLLARASRTQRQQERELQELRRRYAPVINLEEALQEREQQLVALDQLAIERRAEMGKLNAELGSVRAALKAAEGEADLIACGHYRPQFDFGTSEHYRELITGVREKQRDMIKAEKAAACAEEWLVNGSEAEGRKATKRTLRLMLRAFNGECDAIIASVSWSNIDRMLDRLSKSFDAINKLGESYHCAISRDYFMLRKAELEFAYGYQAKLQKEKDEQRALREQMREEEKARREMEAAIRQAALDEERAKAALEKARAEVAKSTGEKESALNEKIRLLEQKLAEAHANRERAISRAEQTRSGHVYIISNIGSFGEQVFKIGMTRRLDPQERISELGDASVPFEFDVHGMIFTEDAPALEAKLHERFDEKRVNLINDRKEFFLVTIEEIQTAVAELGANVALTKLAEAREYRETVELRRNVTSAPQTG